MDIKRYDVDIPNSSYIAECVDGEFVGADDHDRIVLELNAEIARLQKGLTIVHEHAKDMYIEGWKAGWNANTDLSQEAYDNMAKSRKDEVYKLLDSILNKGT